MTAAGLVAVVAGMSPVLFVSEPKVTIDDRISSYGVEARLRQIEDERAGSFYDRMIAPAIGAFRRYLERTTPEAVQEEVNARLELAGRPYGLTAADFVVVRAACGVVGATIGLLLGWAVGSLPAAVIAALLVSFGGWHLPRFWLSRAVQSRRDEIIAALPPALDLLVVGVDAGLSFEIALARVIDKMHNALTAELDQVQKEVALGRPRSEALENLARRAQVEDVQRLVNALLQADQLGVPIARTLRTQATEARRLALQRTQQLAAQAPVKMVIPMIVFILPTVWIILLGPALISLLVHGL